MIPLEPNQKIEIVINFVPNETGIEMRIACHLITTSILEGVEPTARVLNIAEACHSLREAEEQLTNMLFNDNVDLHQKLQDAIEGRIGKECPIIPN